MFGKGVPSTKKAKLGWWLGAVGLGALLLLNQMLSNSQPATPTPPPAQATLSPDEALQAAYDSSKPALLLTETPAAESQSMWQMGGSLFVKLIFIVGLIYLSLAGLRRLQKGRAKVGAGGTTVSLLETVGLAPGRALHVISVGEKTLLIGATDHQITLLSELPDLLATPDLEFENTLQQHSAEAERPPAGSEDWSLLLDNLRNGVHHLQETIGRR